MATSIFSNIHPVDNRTISFTLSPTKYQYANTLRRAIQSMVPCLGFRADIKEDGSTSDVKIMKNSTPMSNEMLADRVGLLPIAMPKGMGTTWNKNAVLFRLHVKNETDDVRYVTASDFECLALKEGAEERTRVPNTDFFHPDPVTGETCLIAVLKPLVEGQPPEEIELEAYASMGIGREHVRFNPTCQCAYGNTLDTDEKRITALWIEWLREQKKVDPKDLESDTARKERLEKEFRSLEIQRCFLVDEEGEPYSFEFTVETLGTMNVYTIVGRALQGLIALCETYQGLHAGDLPDNVDIRPTDKAMKGYDVFFQGEDHTLGNMLQCWIVENRLDREDGVSYVGYNVPHPLRDEMKMSFGVRDGKVDTVRRTLAEAAKGCMEMFSEWFTQFVSQTAGQTEILMAQSSNALQEAKSAEKPDRTMWNAHAEFKTKEAKGKKK